MEDAGDKLTAEDKAPVEQAVAKLEETLKSGTTDQIKADMEALEKAVYAMSTKLYQQSGPQDGAGNPNGGNNGNGDGDGTVYDADFTDKT